jgi:hypothetical protein
MVMIDWLASIEKKKKNQISNSYWKMLDDLIYLSQSLLRGISYEKCTLMNVTVVGVKF